MVIRNVSDIRNLDNELVAVNLSDASFQPKDAYLMLGIGLTLG